MTHWGTVTWDTARAGGFAAYILLTLAVTAGLILRNRWQSDRWPRLITNELHGYLSLLGLVFIAVHIAALIVDPFTHFGLKEIVLPFASHYRPLWMGLGIVALYLLLAVWLSTRLRTRIGHRLWRQIHLLAFLVYAAATVHGLGSGSDTRTSWAMGIYGVSVAVVGGLTARRLLVPVTRGDHRRPLGAALAGLAVAGLAAWAFVGPLAAGWGLRAGGARKAVVAVPQTKTTVVNGVVNGVVKTPFVATFTGRATVSAANDVGLVTVRIHGALRGGTRDHLEILVHGAPLNDGGVSMQASHVTLGAATALYTGRIVKLSGLRLVAAVSSNSEKLRLNILLRFGSDGSARGTVRGTSLGTTT
jgi:DMSO/TMAO reductase YedYZ heme-binding membrane subunit